AIGMLKTIIGQEGIAAIEPRVYDINDANLGATYDFISCTVTLMFLDPVRINDVLADMQDCTRAGGYNLIVAAMHTDNYPCPMNFCSRAWTLMFLYPVRLTDVLADMHDFTRAGGYNLIVAAMHTDNYPCPMNFPFTLGEGQLSTAYDGWELLKYNENLGTMHNGAQLQFATMLARKTC